MDESKQRAMVTKSSSSIKRKPLASLTNILRKPNHTSLLQSKKPVSSTASNSSIGSTQNPINLHRPILIPPDQPIPSKSQRLTPVRLSGDENQTGQAQRHGTCNTRSTTKADVPYNQTSFQERTNNLKEGSVSFGSSTLGKIKDQGKINQFSTEKINGKRKSVDVPLSVMKNTKNSTGKDKAKVNVVQSNTGAGLTMAAAPFHQTSFRETRNSAKAGSVSLDKTKDQWKINLYSTEKISNKRKSVDVPLSSHITKNANYNTDKDKGKENVVPSNTGLTMADDSMRRKEKGKAIAESPDYPSRKKLKNYMMDFNGPLKGVVIKERDGTVTGSGGVSTPIKYHTLEKKSQQISCPPILRTMSNRNDDADGEEVFPSKIQTEPPPNKKKRRCAAKEVMEEYTLPKEFVEQQKAYFKEIDDFELEVEEVSV